MKSSDDLKRERELLSELLELVQKRSFIVDSLEEERVRYLFFCAYLLSTFRSSLLFWKVQIHTVWSYVKGAGRRGDNSFQNRVLGFFNSWCIISKTKDQELHHISKHWEVSWKYIMQWSILSELQGVRCFESVQTPSVSIVWYIFLVETTCKTIDKMEKCNHKNLCKLYHSDIQTPLRFWKVSFV